jgi:hypothetical protein
VVLSRKRGNAATGSSLDFEFVLEDFQQYLSTLADDEAKHNAVFAKLTERISAYSDIGQALTCTKNALEQYKNYQDVVPLLSDAAELSRLLEDDLDTSEATTGTGTGFSQVPVFGQAPFGFPPAGTLGGIGGIGRGGRGRGRGRRGRGEDRTPPLRGVGNYPPLVGNYGCDGDKLNLAGLLNVLDGYACRFLFCRSSILIQS